MGANGLEPSTFAKNPWNEVEGAGCEPFFAVEIKIKSGPELRSARTIAFLIKYKMGANYAVLEPSLF
jgi:hypothetical protein